MGVKGSIQVSEDLLQAEGAVKFLALLQALLSDPKYIPNLAGQMKDAYALTQPEIDERDAAAKTVSDATAKLAGLQAQYDALQQTIEQTKKQAKVDTDKTYADANAYKNKVNADAAETGAVLDGRSSALARKESDLLIAQKQLVSDQAAVSARESAVTKREKAVAKIEAAQKNLIAVAGQANSGS